MPTVHEIFTSPEVRTLFKKPKRRRHSGLSGDQKYTKIIAPCKYGYAQASNNILRKIDLSFEVVKTLVILNSGATGHFLFTDASAPEISVAKNSITVAIPDGSKITLTRTQELDLPLLPKAARSGHVLPGMLSYSLIAVVTLCNSGCRVVFEE